MTDLRVAVAQVRAISDSAAAVETVAAVVQRASAKDVQLVVFPEALIGGYPRGAAFGAAVGERSSVGREESLAYRRNAVTVPGPEVDRSCPDIFTLTVDNVLGGNR